MSKLFDKKLELVVFHDILHKDYAHGISFLMWKRRFEHKGFFRMTASFSDFLDPIGDHAEEILHLLIQWGNINTHTHNPEGLAKQFALLRAAFSGLEADERVIPSPPLVTINAAGEKVELPLGDHLLLTKRPEAPIQVYLGGHYDTVFPIDSPFQTVKQAGDTLIGPGVTDMKGGLLICLQALSALESSPFAEQIGWRLLINSDEEIGSPSSGTFIADAAKECHLGLLFEPSMPDGSFAAARKGSGNYTVIVRGRNAHVGRAFAEGRNALAALAEFIVEAHRQNKHEDVILNVGKVDGGGPVNVVPDLALCRFNIRVSEPNTLKQVEEHLQNTLDKIGKDHEVEVEWVRHHFRAPKPFTGATLGLFMQIQSCADSLGQETKWKDTGGVCDGNIVAQQGIPVIDTLGARGYGIHTTDETFEIASLTERAQLAAYYLMRLASGELSVPKGENHETVSR